MLKLILSIYFSLSSCYCKNPLVEKLVDYSNNLQGFLVHPVIQKQIPKRPAIIIFHAFTGRTEFENEKARSLAKLGYVAFAADTYGKTGSTETIEGNFEIMKHILGNRTTILRERILAAWTFINSLDFVDSNRIGSIGYCYGGLCSLDLARFEIGLKAAVSFHGTLLKYPEESENLKNISCAIQAHHGDLDIHTNNEEASNFIEEMRNRSMDWQFLRYSNAEHAFTLFGVDDFKIPGASYNEKASNRSWSYMQVFLAEKLL
ncbi:unnamed protein product [Caenorhabditis angaria]|uniref:Dienelactone hydrolase domain-containing protein n=1 Tax=Caenorhabditis angaria TaxID=860376 RepID=A0A9P1IAG7_9PELO|nr:unnamed protein product [Caenorhabditis angaria]